MRKGNVYLIKIAQMTMVFAVLIISGCSSKDSELDNPGDEIIDTPVKELQTIGLNFNEQLNYIDLGQINATNTTWVRGFWDFFQFYNAPSTLNTDEKVTKYLTLKPNGYKTILNIKWLFKGKSFPVQGSQEMDNYMAFLDTMLDKAWSNTDIIVVGNEPFIETDAADYGDSMYNFYVSALNRVKAYADNHTEKPIYFGSFDNMYQEGRRTLPVLNGLLDYCKSTPWIAGVDMHIHHSENSEMISALDFVNAKIRGDQKILITEYSLMKWWRSNLQNNIPNTFASQYGYSSTMKNYQYIDIALKAPVSREQWIEFLSKSNWFESRKNYLLDTYTGIFKKYDKFYVATYAFRQSYPFDQNFTSNTDPWVLNGIYANRTLTTDAFGKFQFNYSFIDDFRIVQDFVSK